MESANPAVVRFEAANPTCGRFVLHKVLTNLRFGRFEFTNDGCGRSEPTNHAFGRFEFTNDVWQV